jgi:hypothetical protein
MTFSTDVNALSQSKVTARAHDVRTRHMSVAHTVGASFVTSASYGSLSWIMYHCSRLPRLITDVCSGSKAKVCAGSNEVRLVP